MTSKSCLTPEIPGQLIDRRISFWVIALCAFFWGAAPGSRTSLVVKELGSPATRGSQTPFLHSTNGRLFISWQQEVRPQQVDLLFSKWQGTAWSSPRSIVSGASLFYNWADFPSVIGLDNGSIAAHWLQKSASDSSSYDVMVSVTKDGGSKWSAPVKPYRDTTKAEHGFVSLVPQDKGRFTAVWLDSRKYKGQASQNEMNNEMQLMASSFDGTRFGMETVLDPRTCDCCQTSAVVVPGGLFVAYRDRSEKEIRDISYVRSSGGKWSAPKTLHPDGWHIMGCPVNGPAATSMDNKLAIAWFTAAGDKPHVKAAVSNDGGRTFGKPLRIDGGNPTGRVDTEFLADGSVLVAWLENVPAKGAEVHVRRINIDGSLDDPVVVGQGSTERAAGFPRMARWQRGAVLSWTNLGKDDSRIRVVSIQPR